MARWHSCNVLHSGSSIRNLWQFGGSGKFSLQREEAKLPNEPLPVKTIAKDWQTLFQPKLNIAWLPADKVFLRVIQLPKGDPAETQSMVEFQLEKASPLPVAQIVWGFELLPQAVGEMQTAIVIIVARSFVEEFLGNLEGQGYLADRLELPLLDQLRATSINEDGVWIYPDLGADGYSCMVAWWSGGVLQNLSIVHLPPNEHRGRLLQEQLNQMNWAGELEGWLTSTPRYHLVADHTTGETWKQLFSADFPLEVVPTMPATELAALTARRVTNNGLHTNLLPPEFSTRYRQQFIDRLWMRALGAVLLLYVICVVIYFGFVQVAQFRLSSVQTKLAATSLQYTNTVQLREKVRVLQDQLDLQFAALECYKAVSDVLPPELTLDSMNFERGRKFVVFGSASTDDTSKIQDFNEALRKVVVKNQEVFSKVNPPSINPRAGGQLAWSFSCELKRGDAE